MSTYRVQTLHDRRQDTPEGDAEGAVGRRGRRVLVSSVSSDSHTWNLVFLQLLLEEMGHEVTNIGSCVPDELLVEECRRVRPELVVISSVNGHGALDGARAVRRLREQPDLRDVRVVIGGKLGVRGAEAGTYGPELVAAGFDAVFEDAAGVAEFRRYLAQAPGRAIAASGAR
ncbi:cobalamin-dependent protein [Streptomyces somaliensis]|uniref:cobalamin B12-binding domain-containing protein n=1 Tax=Streptomyces somaliensis TaxID=78355 RepID=UPI0020CE0A91|nr:cobalamin-dependent protein [Streptomyces somaliensis]MCP9945759.1 cobalamin-dependent protein [Streptomyces somaliensis]MCP9961064.1 cobalamin-dependent protein [Streptomyces somaliensis]MCP9973857.1 cobalamin-dependent protein [Streptomyces somaliensis]